MFVYDKGRMSDLLEAVIKKNVTAEVWNWLHNEATHINEKLNVVFAALPRKTGKAIVLSVNQEEMQSIRPGLSIHNWTIDRIARVWLLLQIDPADKNSYIRQIENLFLAAEMNELVALYSSLPLLAYPESWRKRCTEGIRSNIGLVLESIMCDNPYPSEQLDEAAWNQLVLKAIFTEKPIHRIIGLDERANQALANTLSDYAHERWAAHRTVHPLLWRCVVKFIDEKILNDIQRIALSENNIERKAAALVCAESTYAPANAFLNQNDELKKILQDKKITWDTLAADAEKVQLMQEAN